MVTGFERAGKVIDALFPVAKRLIKSGTVEDMVKSRLRGLSQAYGGNNLTRSSRSAVDYSRTTTHIAYIYRCLGAHSDWVCRALALAQLATVEALAKKAVKIAAVGGGPGSDIAGVLKFSDRHNVKATEFNFEILDREPAWDRCRSELVSTFSDEFSVSERRSPLDLTKNNSWVSSWDFSDADIFTFSFVLSEVWSFNTAGSVTGFLDEILKRAKKGALFCYVDNGGDKFTPCADTHFNKPGIKLLASEEAERMFVSSDEQCDVLSKYREKFGQMPKLTGNVAIRIWKKVDD